MQEAFADAFAVGNTGGFLELHMNEIARVHNHPGVHFVVDRYFDAIANVDADRLAAIDACPVGQTLALSIFTTPPVVRALRRANFLAAISSSPSALAKACAVDTQTVARTVFWAYANLAAGPSEMFVALALMVDANPIARTAKPAHHQGASFPVISRLANTFAGRDVACTVAAALFRACLVATELTRSAEEPRLAVALTILAYTSFIAQPGAAFHRACPAHVPCFAVTAALLAESVFRAVVLTTRLVAVGSNEVVGVAFGTSWTTVVARADTCPIAGARAVIAAVAGTDGLCAVLPGPTTLAQAVVVDAASVSRTCLVARVSGASLSTPAVFAVASAVHATTMLAASRLA